MKKYLVVLMFSLLFFLSGCGSGPLDYSDFASISIDDPEDQLDLNFQTYYLYFYSPTCTACLSVKNEVLNKLALLENDKVFLVETMGYDDVNDNIDVTNIPTLVRIVNGEVDEYFVGTTEVIEEFAVLS